MTRSYLIRILFAVAAAYDGVLGLGFLFAGPAIFRAAEVTPPNHWGYVQFAAALLVVFALMFAMVAVDPIRNRNLVPFGMLLKVSYCGVAFRHWASQGIPDLWKPWAVADALFLLLFVWAWFRLGKPARNAADNLRRPRPGE